MSSKKRKFSLVWQHFSYTNEDEKVMCDICKDLLSIKGGSTGNLKKHLQRKHPCANLHEKRALPNQDVDDIDAAPACSVITSPADGGQPCTSQQTTQLMVDNSACDIVGVFSQKSQSSIMQFVQRNTMHVHKKKVIDRALIKMVYKDLQPISIVENEGFREYSKDLNPTYSLPSRKTVSKSLLPAAYEEKKNSLKNVLSAVQNICLSVDCWSNQKAGSYMAVTGHFIDEHMHRKMVLIDCSIFDERHSAKNIAENIIHICQPYFPMEKVSLIVTDNAKNMINAVDSELKTVFSIGLSYANELC
ncbi:Zinc finger BED domain-containing protein 6, partial [Stegodyphus mimosarum]